MKNLKTALLLVITWFILHPITKAQLNAQIDGTHIQKLLDKHYQTDQPGVTFIATKGERIIFNGAAGLANLELNVPMQADHVLRIGSITKQFTGIAILMLQEQGKLNIQDDLTKFLPNYPTQGKKITVEHLLTHTSGIRSYTDLSEVMDNLRPDLTPSQLVDKFKNKTMLFEPGEQMSYNNSGYFLLGMIIEKASGMSYEDFIEKNIFEKVGMNNSYYDQASQIIPRRAAGYEMDNGEIVNAPYLSMTIPYAAGSLLSTVEDLYKWNQAVHSYKLVSKASLEKALTSYILNDGEKTNYGYGWGIRNFFGNTAYQHSGGVNGFVSDALYLPEEDIFVAAFSNGENPSFLTQVVAAQLLGKYPLINDYKSLSKEAMADYIGIYQVENSKQKRTIRIEGDHLTSIRTGGQLHHLYAFEKDKFYMNDAIEIFEFKRDKTGKVRGIVAQLSNGKTGRAIKTKEDWVEQKEIQLDKKILENYVGKYQIEPGFFLNFTIEDNSLWVQPTGDSKLPLFAKGDHHFFLKAMDAQLEFVENENKITEVKVNLGGEKHVGKKL